MLRSLKCPSLLLSRCPEEEEEEEEEEELTRPPPSGGPPEGKALRRGREGTPSAGGGGGGGRGYRRRFYEQPRGSSPRRRVPPLPDSPKGDGVGRVVHASPSGRPGKGPKEGFRAFASPRSALAAHATGDGLWRSAGIVGEGGGCALTPLGSYTLDPPPLWGRSTPPALAATARQASQLKCSGSPPQKVSPPSDTDRLRDEVLRERLLALGERSPPRLAVPS